MKTPIRVCWISAGISSFIAGYIANKKNPVDKFIYIDIEDQHPDSIRFIKDCEKILGKEIEVLRSEEYKNVENAICAAGMIKMPWGYAPCTNWLKKRVRKKWEYEALWQEGSTGRFLILSGWLGGAMYEMYVICM